MTSVDLIRAASSLYQRLRFISRADREVMIEVMCCSPMEMHHFRHKPADADTLNPTDQLIPAAQTTHDDCSFERGLCSGAEQKAIDFALGNAMVPPAVRILRIFRL